jgi:acetoacetate decarboxylase
MPVRGLLTKDHLGFSMPSYAPLFPKPPYSYKNASLMVFPYETSEVAAQMVPNVMELADPPTAALVFATYPSSTLGPYDEVVQYVDVTFKGVKYRFATFLYVTTDSAMAAGREMGGYPKKIGKIEFLPGPAWTAALERPAGLRLCTGTMRAEQRVPPKDVPTPMALDYLTLRYFPSPQTDQPPTWCEILKTEWTVNPVEVWMGTGSCHYTGASALDPLQLAPIVKAGPCEFITGDIQVNLNTQPGETPF